MESALTISAPRASASCSASADLPLAVGPPIRVIQGSPMRDPAACGSAPAGAALVVAEEGAVGRDDHGGVAAAERALVGLHRAVEAGEGRVLPEAAREDARAA